MLRFLLSSLTPLAAFCLFSAGAFSCTQPPDSTGNGNRFLVKRLETTVDSIVVVKHFRHMYVFHSGKLLKVYRVSLGTSPVGAKHFQGDRKTPEGQYRIVNKNPHSAAYKSLAISYPNNTDREYARKAGKPTGGDVMIHGLWNGWNDNDGNDYTTDWTWGCIAVSNAEMDELFVHVVLGCPIHILP